MWQRVPTEDDQGRPLNDFMMLIPKLRHWPAARRQTALQALQQVFSEFDQVVVFADLNLKLNLLWISMRPQSGGCIGLAAAIQQRLPEAVLVANQAEVILGAQRRARRGWWRWFRARTREQAAKLQGPG
jgi:hypothetical protein